MPHSTSVDATSTASLLAKEPYIPDIDQRKSTLEVLDLNLPTFANANLFEVPFADEHVRAELITPDLLTKCSVFLDPSVALHLQQGGRVLVFFANEDIDPHCPANKSGLARAFELVVDYKTLLDKGQMEGAGTSVKPIDILEYMGQRAQECCDAMCRQVLAAVPRAFVKEEGELPRASVVQTDGPPYGDCLELTPLATLAKDASEDTNGLVDEFGQPRHQRDEADSGFLRLI